MVFSSSALPAARPTQPIDVYLSVSVKKDSSQSRLFDDGEKSAKRAPPSSQSWSRVLPEKQQCMQAQGGFTDCVSNITISIKTVHLLIRGYLHSNIDSFQNKITIFQKVVHDLIPLENKSG